MTKLDIEVLAFWPKRFQIEYFTKAVNWLESSLTRVRSKSVKFDCARTQARLDKYKLLLEELNER